MKNNSLMQTTDTLVDRVAAAMAATQPGTKERQKALMAIKWVLCHESGLCAGLNGLDCALVQPASAQVFSGCDNEVLKLKFWQMSLGVALTVVVL